MRATINGGITNDNSACSENNVQAAEEVATIEKTYWAYVFDTLRKDLSYYHSQSLVRETSLNVSNLSIEQQTEISNTLKSDRSHRNAEGANFTMDVVFAACSLALVGTTLATMIVPGSAVLALIAAGITLAWNYIDAGGGYLEAHNQNKKKEIAACIAIAVASTALLGANTAYLLSIPTIHIIAGSLGTILASGGASIAFAACMFVAAGVEFHQIAKGNQRIKTIQDLLDQRIKNIPDSGKSPQRFIKWQGAVNALYNSIKVERAEVERHRTNGLIWTACGMGMTGAAVLTILATTGVLALGSVSFGIVPVVAAACFLIGVLRYK